MDERKRQPLSLPLHSGNWEQGVPLQWREFIRFCHDMRYGEIERLSIQDGFPVLAEMTKKKVKFTREP